MIITTLFRQPGFSMPFERLREDLVGRVIEDGVEFHGVQFGQSTKKIIYDDFNGALRRLRTKGAIGNYPTLKSPIKLQPGFTDHYLAVGLTTVD